MTRFIECAENSRSYLDTVGDQRVKRTHRKLGTIGVAEWIGVPLPAVLDGAGIKPSATSALPERLDGPHVRWPMPIEMAGMDETPLVRRMNGSDLPPDSGDAVRVRA